MHLLLLSLLFTLPLLFHFIKNKKPTSNVPPGPLKLPLIGNLYQLDNSCLPKCFWELSKKYGPLMFMKFGSIPTLVISSARLAEEVMKTQDAVFCSRAQLRGFRKISYEGLDIALAPYGPNWREMRKMSVIHLLSAKRTQQFRPIREDELSRMIERIKTDAKLNQVTNVSSILLTFTNTVICRIAFGKRWDEEAYERKRFHDILRETEEIFVGFYFSDYIPSMGWVDRLTGIHNRLENVFKKLDAFFQEIIDEHLDPKRPKSMDDDIIDIMLQLQRDGSSSFIITMDHIKAMLMDMFFAGTETSAVTVIWTMTALMKNPHVMRMLQEEIREVVGEKDIIDEDDIDKLPYLKATMKESMRLYPAAPLAVPRETLEKCNIDGYEIQPKTMVYVNIWGIGRDPESWENPLDFSPERFLKSDIDLKGQDFRLIPFGSGRRNCPGYLMGFLTVHLLVGNLIHSFDWQLPPGMKVEDIDTQTLPGLNMHKKNALKLVAKYPAFAGK